MRTGNRRPPAWFGALFILAGAPIVGVGAGWIPVDPTAVHAPGWVIVLCGGIFMLAGTMFCTQGLGENVVDGLAFLLVAAFGTVFGWIAFGPGTREFTGSGGTGPVSAGGRAGELPGRIAFGIGAILIGIIAVAVLVRLLRRLRARV